MKAKITLDNGAVIEIEGTVDEVVEVVNKLKAVSVTAPVTDNPKAKTLMELLEEYKRANPPQVTITNPYPGYPFVYRPAGCICPLDGSPSWVVCPYHSPYYAITSTFTCDNTAGAPTSTITEVGLNQPTTLNLSHAGWGRNLIYKG
jgi:hypothetical protein